MQSKPAAFSFIAAFALSFCAVDVLAGPVGARSAQDRDIELELLLIKPPVVDGSRLGLVLASPPQNMSLLSAGNHAKSSPATSPSAYADMVFTAVTPCRILDTRTSQGGAGPWPAGSTNSIKIGPYPAAGGGYATGAGAQGGSSTGCGLDTLAGPGKIAVVMVAVSTVAQASAGYLTFFSAGAPNPGAASVSQWYQPGYVQTSFVLIPSDLVGAVSASGFSSATTEVIIDVAGYFAAPGNINLANSTATTGNILKGGNPFIHNFGPSNTFIGVNAGNFTMTGVANTASGANALLSNTTGSYNSASGTGALSNNTIGNDNTASGVSALSSNTGGYSNTASGTNALFSNTGGWRNTASGYQALSNNTVGDNNTASGVSALSSNTGGYSNTASGSAAMLYNTTGDYNTACGTAALAHNTTGALNIGIGYNAGYNLTTGSNNIDIGNFGAAAEANTIRIGAQGTQTRAFIAGISGVTTAAAGVAVLVDSNGQLGTISSSRRYKDDIADMDTASSALMKLRPVTFHYKTDQNASGRTLQYGLVAEEVAEVYPGLIAHSNDGQVETVMYQFLPPMLLNEYQKQQRRIDTQSTKIEAQASRIEAQTSRIDAQARKIDLQTQRIAELETQTSRIAALERVVTNMSEAMDQLRRSNSVTASLPSR